jgi:hypothetical protein
MEKIMLDYNAPCRALIFATLQDGRTKKVSIPFTGYGSERHAERWLAKGASRVTVCLWSKSTGKNLCHKTFYDAATVAKQQAVATRAALIKKETDCDWVSGDQPRFNCKISTVVTDDFGNKLGTPLGGEIEQVERSHGFTGLHDDRFNHRGFEIF